MIHVEVAWVFVLFSEFVNVSSVVVAFCASCGGACGVGGGSDAAGQGGGLGLMRGVGLGVIHGYVGAVSDFLGQSLCVVERSHLRHPELVE